MSNNLPTDFHGLDLHAIANVIDRTFGFPSDWDLVEGTEAGSYEFGGKIVVDYADAVQLGKAVDAGPADMGHVLRYMLGHLKTHHYQDLNPNYEKTYEEDMRPYELAADYVAGWICASANIPNSFRAGGMASEFNDFVRRVYANGESKPGEAASKVEYPWPDEREVAFRRGARAWSLGQVTHYNHAAVRQGIPDEDFHDFVSSVPAIVHGMWSRRIPNDAKCTGK